MYILKGKGIINETHLGFEFFSRDRKLVGFF